MPSTDDLALLSYMAYTPSDTNSLPTGDWQEIPELQRNEPSGMRASVFVNSAGEVVIAYRGTDVSSVSDFVSDVVHGDMPAPVGHHSDQVSDAIELLADVRARFPTAAITLTGHSLGGGLASLLATYFYLPSVVFDPAPFGNSATDFASLSLRADYYGELTRYINDVYPSGTISPASAAALAS